MNKFQHILCASAITIVSLPAFAQTETTGQTTYNSSSEIQQKTELKITGKVIDAKTNLPLEYTTVAITSPTNPNYLNGDLTDSEGKFNIPITSGTYNISFDFLGYTTYTLKDIFLNENKDLGIIKLGEDSETIDDIVINVEKSPVELYLDKKVYNVGNDIVVRGGNAGDVLDNIPSVQVDSDGNVSLRGNESVRVLIDGRPTGMAASISDALKMLSADAIEQVEVITNPSARYEAEGGGGIINIKLKKGANTGFNGSTTITASNPWGYGASANLNYKGKGYNIYSNLGYRNNKSFGNSLNETRYFDETTGETTQFVNEYSKTTDLHKGFNGNIGFDLELTSKLTWSNNLGFRKGSSDNTRVINYDNLAPDQTLNYANVRNANEVGNRNSLDYTTDFLYNFDKKGHQLTVSGTLSKNNSDGSSDIATANRLTNVVSANDLTNSTQEEVRNQLKADYVLPIGNGRFEAGYMGNFNELTSTFGVKTLDANTNTFLDNTRYQSNLEYKENIQALYTQYGNKIDKWNYMVGLRWEGTNIDINQYATNSFNKKSYNSFFPSAFLNYEITTNETVGINYSRRVRRPRGWFLNPISNYSSSINVFIGNPNLDPSFTDSFQLEYMKKWGHFTLNTSAYFNHTKNATTVVRRIDGVNEEGIPITYSTPINLATEYRTGLEFNLTYNPYKWWRMNGNINLYQMSRRGDYTFTDYNNNNVTQNFDVDTFTWTARLINRVTLPYDIEWQTNGSFRAGEKTAQGRTRSTFDVNLAFSKDIIKDKASVSLNVQDLFNSRKRMIETNLSTSSGYTEMQWRERTINFSFTYRFNESKKENQRKRQSSDSNDSYQEEMM